MGRAVRAERESPLRHEEVQAFIAALYEGELHTKRVTALAGATLGVMASASLAVAVIGQALAQARGLVTKHAIKQVDRLLSNAGIDVWDSFARWVPRQIGARRDILVAMDWTDYDRDGQATLVLSLVTGHGRATPLLWLSAWKDELTQQRNAFEDACLVRLKELVPEGCRVTILADRGFGDQNLFGFLAELGFGYVIRFRGNIQVTDAHGETRPAAEWVGTSGRARKLREARGEGPAGRRRRLCPGQGHEGLLVPRGQQRRGAGCRTGQPLRAAVDDRAALPRYERPALRHGAQRHPHRRADPARPPAPRLEGAGPVERPLPAADRGRNEGARRGRSDRPRVH